MPSLFRKLLDEPDAEDLLAFDGVFRTYDKSFLLLRPCIILENVI